MIKCKNCSENCKKCKDTPDFCTECKGTDVRFIESGTSVCMPECPIRFYPKSGDCFACAKGCLQCNEFTCLLCEKKYALFGTDCLCPLQKPFTVEGTCPEIESKYDLTIVQHKFDKINQELTIRFSDNLYEKGDFSTLELTLMTSPPSSITPKRVRVGSILTDLIISLDLSISINKTILRINDKRAAI